MGLVAGSVSVGIYERVYYDQNLKASIETHETVQLPPPIHIREILLIVVEKS